MSDYFLFVFVFIKKNNQIKFFLKNQNWFKSIEFGSIRFLSTKTGLTQFFCLSLVWFFSVLGL
jgi:hypothetical protein